MRSRLGRLITTLSIGLAVGAASGCASGDSAARSPSPAYRPFNVFPSSLDVRLLRAQAVVAPAMVAIYAIEGDGGITFDRRLSSEMRGSVDTRVGLTDAALIDFKRIESTPLLGPEFYNRMDRASAQVTNHCLGAASSCTGQAVAYEATVSSKFRTWEEPLGTRYVAFLRITGAYRTPTAIQNPILTSAVLGFLLGGVIGGVIGGSVSAASIGPDGAVASLAVLDLQQGKIVWFKIKPIAHSHSIPETCNAVAALLDDLF